MASIDDPDFVAHAHHDGVDPSLRDYLEQRISLEVSRIDTEISRIDKAVEVFRHQYEERHEQLRQEVMGMVTQEARSAAVGADRRWLFASAASSVILLITLSAFLLEHFAR